MIISITTNKVHVNIEALMNSEELELPNGLKMTRMAINPNRVNDKSAITFKVKCITTSYHIAVLVQKTKIFDNFLL